MESGAERKPVRFSRTTKRGLAKIVAWLKNDVEMHGGLSHALFRTHDAKEQAEILKAFTWLDEKAGQSPSSVSSVRHYGVTTPKRSSLYELLPKNRNDEDGA